MSFLMSIIRFHIKVVVITLGIYYLLVHLPLEPDVNPIKQVLSPSKLKGLDENARLSAAKMLFKDEIGATESFVKYAGFIYTVDSYGRLLKFDGESYVILAQYGEKNCHQHSDMTVCGRLIGGKVVSSGDYYLVDAYKGVVRVNLSSANDGNGKFELVWNSRNSESKFQSIFLDDIAVLEGAGKNGGNVFFLTDASGKWPLEDVAIATLDRDCSGRILRVDENEKTVTSLSENLCFPNGIELSDDKNSLLINELNKRRVLRLYIAGPKSGKLEQIIGDLPGEPDNIRRSARKDRETYWIGFATAHDYNKPTLIQFLADKPNLTKALLRFAHLVGSVIERIGKILGKRSVEVKGALIKRNQDLVFMSKLLPIPGIALEIDLNGKIVTCLKSPDGRVTLLSEAHEFAEKGGRYLYLGSFYNHYVGKLKLN